MAVRARTPGLLGLHREAGSSRRRVLPRWGALLAILLTGLSAGAEAQEDRSARATVLLREGLEHADAGRWESAEDRFREALEIHPTDRSRYHLARALAERGRLVEAVRHLRAIVHAEQPDLLIADVAREDLARVSARVGTLHARIDGSSESTTLLIDEKPAPSDAARTGIPIDPGVHVLAVTDARGATLARRRIEVSPSETVHVTLHVAPTPWLTAQAGLPPDAAQPLSDEGSGPITTRWWFWTATGAVVVAAVVTVVALSAGGADPTPGDVEPVHVGREGLR